jgi:hypothetical protein
VDEDNYNLSGRIGMVDNFWEEFYAGTLNDLKRIKDQATAGTGNANKDANTIAIADILMAWNLQTMTDLWGPIPVTEALQGASEETITSPKYDNQQAVYDEILGLLDEATSKIVTGNEPFGSADLIYNGDMNKWLKLANSLKLRAYMRLSEVEPQTAASGISQVFSDGNYFESNADNAYLTYQGDPYENPVANFAETREDHKVSSTMVDQLKSLDDPRLHFYAMPRRLSSAGAELSDSYPDGRFPDSVYVGKQNANSEESVPLGAASNMGHYFMAPKSPGFIMTYAEVELILAEAAQRGWIGTTADAKAHYDAGVRASMEMFDQSQMDAVLDGYAGHVSFGKQQVNSDEYPAGMEDQEVTNYLATGPGAFPLAGTNEDKMNAIALQKWIALYGQGVQPWFEWRRLDYPVLTPGPTAVLDQVPTRLFLPSAEQSVNQENYDEAVNSMLKGPDEMTTKVWWDVD